MESLKKLITTIDELPMLYKFLLCIPLVDIVWTIYRTARSVVADNTVNIIINVVILIVGIPFFWLIDLICLLLNGKVWSLD